MTQEDKDLLLKDLCARLPYNVMCRVKFCYKYNDGTMRKGHKDEMLNIEILDVFLNGSDAVEKIQLYLRPMSSMTEEEVEEIRILLNNSNCGRVINKENFAKEGFGVLWFTNMCPTECVGHTMMSIVIDWLNKHHFDYRGLIEKGLAIEVTEENNPYKN